MISGTAGRAGDPREEYVTISRAVWAEVLRALASGDERERDRAYGRLLAVGPSGWDADLERAGPVERRRRIGRAVGAFDASLDAMPVAGRRTGDPDRAEDLAEVMRTELGAAKRTRRRPPG